MTLLEHANFVCGKINQTEANDVAACKGFLTRRHELVWNDQLWKDSLFEYTQTLSALGYLATSTWLPTKQILLLPTAIMRVVAVRTDSRKLNVERSETFYRSDFDAFANAGAAAQYRVLVPVVWETDTVETVIYLGEGGEGAPVEDISTVIDYLAADGQTRRQFAGVAASGTTITTERVDRWSKAVSAADLVFNSITTGISFLTLAATDTVALRRERIQIIGTVPEGAVVRVLGKTRPPSFQADADEPAINGSENLLLTLAMVDMLERERQYGKAQAVKQEAAVLLDQLKRIETVQQAHNSRLIPEGGYAPDYPINSGGFSF